MSDKNKKAPSLRFSGFGDDWEERKFKELANGFNYGLNAAATEFDGENKYLRITDIDDNSHEFDQSGITSPEIDLSNADDYLLHQGDILFARTGASVGKTYRYKDSDGKVYYAGFLIKASIKPEYDSEFVFQNTFTDRYSKFIQITSQRSGQPGVNAEEYGTFQISVPSFDEQSKIGTFFKQLDDLITLQQRKLDSLTEEKQGYLQKMFPKHGEIVPEIRFPEFTEPWEQRKLGDAVEKQIKGKAQFEKLERGEVEYLDTQRLNGGAPILTNGSSDVIESDVLILWDGSKAGTVYTGFSGALGSTLKAYRTNAVGQFVYQFLKRNQQVIYDSYRTPNIPHVQKDFLDVFEIFVPSMEEQTKIGSFFKQLDDLINLQKQELDNLKQEKQAFLQKMFI
ncbi:restriction endonuclease subunit S [Lactococcus insecticola]|uniref:Restriction endonuclease subunit S n=1 Tax=Pseudolactococcus insecticola TaxID=2709158 RepID=A0A6A0B816_9LACT|nr:restriction endonuclease subunit S [Lactococcus insecticola]GFH40591.1 restriction endonuclease subunit S [Lactococcus insecticola]